MARNCLQWRETGGAFRAMFRAALVNDPFEDPVVYLDSKYRRDGILFDLGDLRNLVPRNILKVRHVFVSHAHMDHFIGFDHLLRVRLGRERPLFLYGPPGFLERLEHKIRAYTWNLVENYATDFELVVTEVHPDRKITRRYRCRTGFQSEGEEEIVRFDGLLAEERLFSVRADLIDHGIPCLAFRFEEKNRINFKRNVLDEMELPTGSWLMDVRQMILEGEPDDTPVRAWWKDGRGGTEERILPLGLFRERAVRISPGMVVSYVTDAVFTPDNARRIETIAAGADLLFIEATFLHAERDKAFLKRHLTACQAGWLARRAGARRMALFHFSPKYRGLEGEILAEAEAAFRGEKTPEPAEGGMA